METSLGDNGVDPELGQFQSWRKLISAALGTYLLVCCDLHGVHLTVCRHMQAFAFPRDHGSCSAFLAANTWTSSCSGLLSVAPSLALKQNGLTGGQRLTSGPRPRGSSMVSS